jgi:rsbT co-antagonist protein RsbR
MDHRTVIFSLIRDHRDGLLTEWLTCQRRDGTATAGAGEDATSQARRFLDQLQNGGERGPVDEIEIAQWPAMRELLEDVSSQGVIQGFSPTQTASFVFSLRQPLFGLLRRELGSDVDQLASETFRASRLLDRLGLYTFECYQRTREEVIGRQQQELLELSTPVVELWKGILALPLIGTLDSARTQIVMENLLERIVSSEAEIAIIDITGVPTVDTLVAQHLIKTVSAARLMGADCIISGIRPQIAQTIVHLGLELNVISKATMADAFALALRRLGKTVADRVRPEARGRDANG